MTISDRIIMEGGNESLYNCLSTNTGHSERYRRSYYYYYSSMESLIIIMTIYNTIYKVVQLNSMCFFNVLLGTISNSENHIVNQLPLVQY